MFVTINLENYEAGLVEKVIETYNIPLEFAKGPDEAVTSDDDYFVKTDTEETLYLEEGFKRILKAINSDNRELFSKELHPAEQVEFLRIAAALGVTSETTWLNNDLRAEMPKWQKRIELPLEGVGKHDIRYKLIAERVNTMPGHDEIDIFIEDHLGVVVQDIVRVEQETVKSQKTTTVEHENKIVSVKLYTDETSEDYTYDYTIRVYDDGII